MTMNRKQALDYLRQHRHGSIWSLEPPTVASAQAHLRSLRADGVPPDALHQRAAFMSAMLHTGTMPFDVMAALPRKAGG
jgi:7-keto-8-aminopelargonate synthetase-like enzyme